MISYMPHVYFNVSNAWGLFAYGNFCCSCLAALCCEEQKHEKKYVHLLSMFITFDGVSIRLWMSSLCEKIFNFLLHLVANGPLDPKVLFIPKFLT